jgi:hypothetical protein
MKKITWKKRKTRKTIAENITARVAANKAKAQLPDWLRYDAPTLERMRAAQAH